MWQLAGELYLQQSNVTKPDIERIITFSYEMTIHKKHSNALFLFHIECWLLYLDNKFEKKNSIKFPRNTKPEGSSPK